MDRGGVKRPRSGTPENSNKKKDKTKKKKKSKPILKKPEGGDDNTNSLESTATADGQYMAKILSTFSKMEQSRFEAFKRVSFPCNAISRYVAHCLAQRQQQQQHLRNSNTKLFAGDNGNAPKLQDLVVPGQEEEITTVVAALAKAYAQRLTAAAKTHAQQQQQQSSATTMNSPTETAIRPEHVLQAFYARQEQGQDPGFFLQPNEGVTMGAAQASKEQMKRVAALAAQEDFDQALKDYEKVLKNPPPPQPKPKPKKDTDSDSGSGDEEEIDMDMEIDDS